ncbi:hypothetical protein LXL04_006892 [Taraxacum kok-saghyz]
MGTLTEGTFIEGTNYPHDFDPAEIWEEISGGESLTKGRDKVSNIIHPCIRIAHRILSCTIFARKEPGQINTAELFFIWCMTRKRGPKPDFASFFYHKCHATRSHAKGDICFGGLITVLASGLGIPLSPPFSPIETSVSLDLDALIRMRQIRSKPPAPIVWLHSPDSTPYLTFPNPRVARFDHLDRNTWRIPRTIVPSEPAQEDEPVQEDTQMGEGDVCLHFKSCHHYMFQMIFFPVLTPLYSRLNRTPLSCSIFASSKRFRTVRLHRFGSISTVVETFPLPTIRYSHLFLPFSLSIEDNAYF